MPDSSHWLVNILQRFRGGAPGLARLGLFLAIVGIAASGSILAVREVGYDPLALDYLPPLWVAIAGVVLVGFAAVGAVCLLFLVVPSAYGWVKSNWNTPRRRFARLASQEQQLCLSFFCFKKPELWMDVDNPVVMSLVEKGVLKIVGQGRKRLADPMWVGLQEDANRMIGAARSTDPFKQMLREVLYWQEHHSTWMSR